MFDTAILQKRRLVRLLYQNNTGHDKLIQNISGNRDTHATQLQNRSFLRAVKSSPVDVH